MQETKADMLMSLAKCYEELQEYDKTISYCTAIIQLEMEDKIVKADAHYKRGECYLRMQDYRQAHGDLYKVKLLDPDNKEAFNKLLMVAKHLSQAKNGREMRTNKVNI